MSPFISKNSDSKFFNKKLIGGKAFYLKMMKDTGLNMPDFFIIPTTTINEILAPIRADIELLIAKTTPNNVIETAEKIKQLIVTLTYSESFTNALFTSCTNHFGTDYLIAVRSSATDEDGENVSFAGQHNSFLYVDKKTLTQKITASIISAWSVNALTYRMAHQIPTTNIQYAIIVQNMIDATKSGVGFSMNVQGNMADMILVAGYGIGEGIVTDLVETDSYFINRLHHKITKKIVEKKQQLIYTSSKALHLVNLKKERQDLSTLSDKEVLQVAKLLEKTEKLLENIADIEFSFDKNGNLFILQMRPVTGINSANIKILDNTNIVESYPEISLPLTFGFVKKAYAKVFRNTSRFFWISATARKQLEPIFDNLLGYYSGRIYYRLDNWYRMMSQLFPSEKAMKSWEKAVGLKKDSSDKNHIRFGTKISVYISILWLLINYKRGNKRFFKDFEKYYYFIKDYNTKDNTLDLLKHLEIASDKF